MSYFERNTLDPDKNREPVGSGDQVKVSPDLLGAETLIGMDVCNPSEESLGDIKEIMLNMRTGKVAYAVLSFGGFMGMGNKLLAVPWEALSMDMDKKRFVLDIDKERLDSAPGFDKQHWPDMDDQAWVSSIYAYYGVNKQASDALNS